MKEVAQRLLGALKEYEEYLLDEFECQEIPYSIAKADEYDDDEHDGKYWKIDEHTYVINGRGMVFIIKDWKLIAYKYQAGRLLIRPIKNYPNLFLAFDFDGSGYDEDCFVFNALTLEVITVQGTDNEFDLIEE